MITAAQTEAPGYPYDNGSIASRLRNLPTVSSVDASNILTTVGAFSGFHAFAQDYDPTLGTAVLLHGWPEYASSWEQVAATLLSAGMNVLAYDQRGYSPGVRPEPVEQYAVSQLMNDLLAVTEARNIERFNLVGHDWGGVVGWSFADTHADKLQTFTAVATAHPAAHGQRMKEDQDQFHRMDYLRAIRDHPDAVTETLLRDGGVRLISLYENKIPAELATSYVERFSEPGAFDAALKYYRALGSDPLPGKISVPTCYIWGSGDVAFTRGAAELTAEFVNGPYTFVPLEGASHWLCEEHPDVIAREVVALAQAHRLPA